MHLRNLFLLAALLAVGGIASAAEGEKYLLRYKFQPGETVRWKVEHRLRIRTTAMGATQNAETASESVKVWKVTQVKPDGTAVFEHSVEDIDMRQQLAGCIESRYNSKTDKDVPAGFEGVAKAVGATLSVVTLDPMGKIVERERRPIKFVDRDGKPLEIGGQADGEITIPLPEAAVAIDATWTRPHDIEVTTKSGRIVRVKTLQRYALREVKSGVATIDVSTQILTPVRDPQVESQLTQYAATGSVRFDIEAGRVLGQQMDLDKSVIGFQGDASSIHYITRFSEELVLDAPRMASKPERK